jgi:hypothetical protein
MRRPLLPLALAPLGPILARLPRAAAPLLLAVTPLLLAVPAWGGPPEEGRCPTVGGIARGGPATDAAPIRLRAGMVISQQDLLLLRRLLPDEVWHNRHAFFHEGMALTIAACHRRYPVPSFYEEATALHAGQPHLDADGNLQDYTVGLPFPPESFDLDAPDAGARWAWNLALRWRGSGPWGRFRIVDMPSRIGKVLTYEGRYFYYQTRGRSDLPGSGYAVPEADGNLFVAGGRFFEPFDARHLAWRQMRPKESLQRYQKTDDTFVYVPTMRKVRRAATTWVDGMYVPRYRVAGDAGGGGIPIGSGGGDYGVGGAAGAINPTAAISIHQTENLPRGFQTLTLRPNAYIWRVKGEREVLAPINARDRGYPHDPDRNFGPHGLSVATDQWDVRWAVVLEGRALDRSRNFQAIVLYVDWQTRQPLYMITKANLARILDIGIAVHRFSDDVVNYPGWPDGQRAQVFDPVAEVFYRVADDSGWRRESYDTRAIPPEERVRRRFTTTDFLIRGH